MMVFNEISDNQIMIAKTFSWGKSTRYSFCYWLISQCSTLHTLSFKCLGSVRYYYFFKVFNQKECIKLIKSYSRYTYSITKDSYFKENSIY